jgi:hypothetical protein
MNFSLIGKTKGYINIAVKSKSIIVILFIISFLIFISHLYILLRDGASITSDTIAYFKMASVIKTGHYPVSAGYSPGYPFLIYIISFLCRTSIEDAANIICFLSFIVSFYFVFKIFRDALSQTVAFSFFSATIILSAKIIASIIFMAHADGVMVALHLAIIFSLFQYLFKDNHRALIWMSLILVLSLWIKNNNIVYIIFVPVAFLSEVNKSKWKYSLLPLLLMLASYLCYRYINGSVHARIENPSFSNLDLSIPEFRHLFTDNFVDLLLTIDQAFLTSYFSGKFPFILNVLLFIGMLLLVIYNLYKNKGSIEKCLFFYIVIYASALFAFNQISGLREINNRTLVTAIITFIILLFYLLRKYYNNLLGYFTLFLFFALSTSFNVVSNYKNIVDSNKETISVIKKFNNQASVKEFKRVVDSLHIIPANIFSNKRRLLSFSFDYVAVSEIPGEKYFHLGKMIEPDSAYISNKNIEISQLLKARKGVVILFDADTLLLKKYLPLASHFRKVDNDYLIY